METTKLILSYKYIIGLFTATILGVPLLAQIDPVTETLKAGGIAGLEITVIVLGFFITIAMFRMFGASAKSMEGRLDKLIEANERVDVLRQERVEDYFQDASKERQLVIAEIKLLRETITLLAAKIDALATARGKHE